MSFKTEAAKFGKEFGLNLAKNGIDSLLNTTGLKKESENKVGDFLGKHKTTIIAILGIVVVAPLFISLINIFSNRNKRR